MKQAVWGEKITIIKYLSYFPTLVPSPAPILKVLGVESKDLGTESVQT